MCCAQLGFAKNNGDVTAATPAILKGLRLLTNPCSRAWCTADQHFLQSHLSLILPGMISGAFFAFGTSDELVLVLFVGSVEQRTLPKVMFSGIREEISPTIIAGATDCSCSSLPC